MPIRPIAFWNLVLLTLSLLVAVSTAGAQERIEWQTVEGADHYRVEIRQDGELVLDTRTDDPWLPLFLPEGEYSFRVRVISPFQKEVGASDWSPLTIRSAIGALVVSFEPSEAFQGAIGDFDIRLQGWSSDADLYLFNSEDQRIPLVVSQLSETTFQARPEGEEPELGTWSVALDLPTGESDRLYDVLVVRERRFPRIRQFQPKTMDVGSVTDQGSLDAGGLEDGAMIRFEGPGPLEASLVRRTGSRKLSFALDLSGAEPGYYTLILENPSGERDTRERALLVRPAPEPPPEPDWDLRVDQREPSSPGDHPYALALGWMPAVPLGDAAKYLDFGWGVMNLSLQFPFINDLFRRAPVLRDMSWEIASGWQIQPTNNPYADEAWRHSLTLGLLYATPFDFPLNAVARAGLGAGFTWYQSDTYSRDDLEGYDSIDFVLNFGLSARVDLGTRFFIDAGTDLLGSLHVSRSVWLLRPRLEGGFRW